MTEPDTNAIARAMGTMLYARDDGKALHASHYLGQVASDGPVSFTGIMMGTAMAAANVIRHKGPGSDPLDLARIVSLGADGTELPDSHPALNAIRVIVAIANGNSAMASDIVHTFVDRVELHGDDDGAMDEVVLFTSSMLVLCRAIVQELDPKAEVIGLHASFEQ